MAEEPLLMAEEPLLMAEDFMGATSTVCSQMLLEGVYSHKADE